MAIREYAPSSEVVVDGNIYKSRYINPSILRKNDSKPFVSGYVCECNRCKHLNYSLHKDELVKCKKCNNTLVPNDIVESIDPWNGFVTSKDKPSNINRNWNSQYMPANEVQYIGDKKADSVLRVEFENNQFANVYSYKDDELLITSGRDFYVCPECGFAYCETESIPKDKRATQQMIRSENYITTRDKHCEPDTYNECDNTKLFKYGLHHKISTDLVKISFNVDLFENGKEKLKDTYYSLLYAILNSISFTLNIDRSDLDGCLYADSYNKSNQTYSIIIFDNVPGGVGHSQRLLEQNGDVFKEILINAYKNMQCDCEKSCYACLRSYSNQRYHDILDRRLVQDFIKPLFHDDDLKQ